MPRRPRIVIPGYAHHITQRGNNRQRVFFDRADQIEYIRLLAIFARRYGASIWAYCLMPNHVHLVARPERVDSLARTMNQTHMCYAQYVNEKQGRSGHLWQGRFYSAVLEETHLICAVRYVERNPVRAGIVERSEDYFGSSAWAHVNGEGESLLDPACPLLQMIDDWKSYLDAPERVEELEVLRAATRKDHVAGTLEFISRVGRILGRELGPGKVGRPKTRSKDAPPAPPGNC